MLFKTTPKFQSHKKIGLLTKNHELNNESGGNCWFRLINYHKGIERG